ncbi:MAG: hypothetical protein A9Z00_11625 [Thermobacillus sp. ZCTH02-B1]|uniref:MFS transporter n=1 Tax=Thermobacillus sp. ZCTH02-B1 TaxID=1858795 RepID=UPI000B575475|nr:MFS transporter [Thermobacillus sp. ZCTH02-B1]OUM95805.1 MAG: hypothetical protein A9Z00_11625 [Thermobacillus sp. ZCTH02-B1]
MHASLKKRDLLLPVLAFCSFLVGFDAIATVPLLPSIAASTDMPLKSGGLLYAGYAAAYAVTAPVMGVLSDRRSRKAILLIGLLLFGASTFLVGTGETFAALIRYRVLTGIGAGMVEPVVYAIASDRYAYEERGRVMGIITAALIASSVVGVPLAGAIGEATSWNGAFRSIAILTLFALIAAQAVIPARRPDRRDQGAPAGRAYFRTVFSDSSVFFSLLGSFLYFGALQGMFALAGVFYHTHYGLGAGGIGLVLLAAGISSVAGSLLGGKWADRRGKRQVVAVAGAAAGVSVFLLGLLPFSLWLSVALHVLWAALYAAGQSAFTALVSELDPQSRGAVLSLNSSAMYIGASAMSTLAAALLQIGPFWTVGFMCGLANLLVTAIARSAIRERGTARNAG